MLGSNEDFPLGRGFVKSGTAWLDRGSTLLWATYSDGGDAHTLSEGQAAERLTRFEGRVRELVKQLKDGRNG